METQEWEHIYVAIDLKSFYASVECVERNLDPLEARLVVADASRTSNTICLAVTPALKAYGLSGRCRLFEVEQKAEEIRNRTGKELDYIVAVPRMALYIEYSARIYEVYMKYISPEDIHIYSIDEVFMEVTHYLKLYNMTPRELTMTMIRDVLRTTGITATAGIAPNLYLCKIAMDIVAKHSPADQDGVRIAELDVEKFKRTLWEHRPITDFWQTGPGTARRLEKNALYTMGDIAELSLSDEEWFYKTFGINAEILIDHAWGQEPCRMCDIKRYKAKSNCTGASQVLMRPYSIQEAEIVLREMAEHLALDLVRKELITDSITIRISYDRINIDKENFKGKIRTDHYGRKVPESEHGTANLKNKTSSTKIIVEAVLSLYRKITDPSLLIRRLSITANRVERCEYRQYDLFTDPQQTDKEKRTQEMMLEIKKRFGKNAVLKGTSLQDGATLMERNRQIGGHRA